MRCARTEEFKYIRNWRQDVGVDPGDWHVIMIGDELLDDRYPTTKPEEELFDLAKDPAELQNVADNPEYADALQDMRERLDKFMESIDDPLLAKHGVPHGLHNLLHRFACCHLV